MWPWESIYLGLRGYGWVAGTLLPWSNTHSSHLFSHQGLGHPSGNTHRGPLQQMRDAGSEGCPPPSALQIPDQKPGPVSGARTAIPTVSHSLYTPIVRIRQGPHFRVPRGPQGVIPPQRPGPQGPPGTPAPPCPPVQPHTSRCWPGGGTPRQSWPFSGCCTV